MKKKNSNSNSNSKETIDDNRKTNEIASNADFEINTEKTAKICNILNDNAANNEIQLETKMSLEKGSIVIPLEEDLIEKEVLGKLRKISFGDIKFKFLLINGPNLNMLGRRDPTQYGTFTLKDVEKLCIDTAFERGYLMDCFQSNYEGAIIDKIHEAMDTYDGIIINPGALTHYSYSILDAVDLCGLPVIETHISDISKREDFRRVSVISKACCGQIKGLGIKSYSQAVVLLCNIMEKRLNQKG